MATPQSSSPLHSPQEHLSSTDAEAIRRRQLAVRLADSIIGRDYAPLVWALYRQRFAEVLEAERRLPELC